MSQVPNSENKLTPLVSIQHPVYGITIDNITGTIYFIAGHLYRLRKNSTNIELLLDDYRFKSLVWDGHNTLFLCDSNFIFSYSIDTGVIRKIAGNVEKILSPSNPKNMKLQNSHFQDLGSITIDNFGNLYVIEGTLIRKISLQDGTVMTLAGSSKEGYKDGPGNKALFRSPTDLVIRKDGTMYVADSLNYCIREIQPDGTVSTLVGSPDDHLRTNWTLKEAKFYGARKITMMEDGTLLVADSVLHILRIIDQASNYVTIHPAWLNQFVEANCLATDIDGNIYVGINNGILKYNNPKIKASLNHMTTWKHIRLFLVGDSGAGKTSLVRWLKGMPFEENHISTDSVDVSTADVNTWESVEFDIKDYMVDIVKKSQPEPKQPSPLITNDNNTHSPPKPKATRKEVLESPSLNVRQSPSPVPRSSSVMSEKKFSIPEHLSQDLRTRIKQTTSLSYAFHVWDFAGQEEYYNTHHFFISESAMYILVIDISKPIDIHRIKFWLNSIKFYVEKAPILLVSTHADLVPNAHELTKNVIDQVKDSNIEHWITVSCNKDLPNETRTLLTTTAQNEQLKKTCNLSWLLFYDSITKDDAPGISYISIVQAEQIASKYEMNAQQTKEALRFFHLNGFVLWYEEPLLNHIIFTKPQQLVDAFKTVITALGLKDKVTSEEYGMLCYEGRMRHETLRELWKEYDAELFRLLKVLLQKFGLAFLDPAQVEDGTPSCDLIIPCLVQETGVEFRKKFLNSEITIYCNIETVPPLGFPNRLISRILDLTNIDGVSWCHIFQSGCTFTQNGVSFLVATPPSGQVIIQAIPQSSSLTIGDLIPTLRQLLEIIYATAKAHKQAVKISTLSKCFICRGKDVLSDLQVEKLDVKKFNGGHFCCSVCRSQYQPKDIQSRILRTLSSSNNTSRENNEILQLVNSPQMWEELCAIIDHNEGWKRLASHLGVSVIQISRYQVTYEMNHKFSPSNDMLVQWLQVSRNATIASLMEIMERIDNQTAKELLLNLILLPENDSIRFQ